MIDPPLVGEPLALDLLNSDLRTPNGDTDLIGSLDQLRHWLGFQRDRMPAVDEQDLESLTGADVGRILKLRHTALDLVEPARHGRQPTDVALQSLNTALRRAPGCAQVAWETSRVATQLRRGGTAGDKVASALAEQVAALLTDEAITKVKVCEEPRCVMLFLPVNPRRRWCIPTVCGNRTRAARYYLRHKDDPK